MQQTGKLIWHEQASSPALDEELADFVANRLREAQAIRGSASLAISGGRTPTGFLRKLGTLEIDWSRIALTLVDERWVPADHPDSNARLVRETLLSGAASKSRFIPLFNDAGNAQAGQKHTELQLDSLHWPLDIVVLGMGDDGHTASLFPQAPELQDALASQAHCIAITPLTAPHSRISLTRSAIISAHNLLLHITGTGKRNILENALETASPPLPIQQVIEAAPRTHIFWAP